MVKTMLATMTEIPSTVSGVLYSTKKLEAPAPKAPPPKTRDIQKGNRPQQPTLVNPKNDVKEAATELEAPTALVFWSLHGRLRLNTAR